jgi:hypothetical protein
MTHKRGLEGGVLATRPHGHMCAPTLGRLIGHLDSVLQDGHREGGGGVACAPAQK